MSASLLPPGLKLLFGMRAVRMFAYGFTAVILVLYLSSLGFSTARIGSLIALTYLGDAVISLWLSTRADRLGRRRTLILGLFLMVLGGAIFALSANFWVLAVAATIGVISPSGNEVGPFLAIEQACLAQVVDASERTRRFAWYHVAGFTAGALGAASGGVVMRCLEASGWPAISAYRALFWAYAGCGVLIFVLNRRLDPSVEPPAAHPAAPVLNWHGLDQSRAIVAKLGALFALDSFAGGFIVQSFVAFWFYTKFGASTATLGWIFFGTNLLSGLSALVAVPIAKRFGLVNTMVWTHLPSNLLLLLVPVMPTLSGAIAVLFLRNSISQMDVPARLSYVNSVVPPAERSAANGITGTARQVGLVLAPIGAGRLLAGVASASFIFWICGGLKIVYDLWLWKTFSHIKPPEESATKQSR